jgi:allophanate hydrolase subunit 1
MKGGCVMFDVEVSALKKALAEAIEKKDYEGIRELTFAIERLMTTARINKTQG